MAGGGLFSALFSLSVLLNVYFIYERWRDDDGARKGKQVHSKGKHAARARAKPVNDGSTQTVAAGTHSTGPGGAHVVTQQMSTDNIQLVDCYFPAASSPSRTGDVSIFPLHGEETIVEGPAVREGSPEGSSSLGDSFQILDQDGNLTDL